VSNGYVKIFRKVLDNPNASNHLFLAVWSYLLLKASHKPYVMRIAGEDRVLNAGDLVCSCRQVAKFFNIDKDTVNRIFGTMEKDSMIRRKMYSRKTVITVSNWSSYQDTPDTNGDTRRDTLGDTLGDTNKKKEERRKIDDRAKNQNASSEKDKEALKLSKEVMAQFNQRAGKSYKDHAGSEHIKHIRARLNEGYTVEELIEVIDHKVKELKGTENEAKWLNPTTMFRPSNIERNLDFARTADDMEIARLIKECKRFETSNPAQAQVIEEKIRKIKQRKHGERPVLQS